MLKDLKKYFFSIIIFYVYYLLLTIISKVLLKKYINNDIYFDILNLSTVYIIYYFTKPLKTVFRFNKNNFKLIIYITIFFIFFNITILMLLFKSYSTIELTSYTKISKIVIIPVIEEIFFRGIMLKYLLDNCLTNKTLNILISVFVTNICFVFLHQSSDLLIILKLFTFSSIVSLIYIITNKLIYCFLYHILINFLFLSLKIHEPFYNLHTCLDSSILSVILFTSLFFILYYMRKIYLLTLQPIK
jgi:membrane protease YdiL (CAAX protease family)